ncbi:lipase class 3 family protein [Actinidia rufa]|uniref:Lipase class 3 family protein n=1 Tax=Actinidia rufa TaxID=165716 RepID=A0A7J0F3P4_9ERIC|nr:lipase class 3 family protein [Actinidia rufa]
MMILYVKGIADICSESRGYLSSLLGAGCECDGYAVRIVGHSLGGAVAAMLGLRLYCRYPNLHVYAYGPLPCMDPIIADACSEFVTSIVYSNEFSARLSVASVLRLRAAALTALSQDNKDASIPSKLARRFLFVSKYEKSEFEEKIEAPNLNSSVIITENRSRQNDQEYSIWQGTDMQDSSYDGINHSDSLDDFTNPFYASPDNINISGDPVSEFMEVVPSPENGSARDLPEVFLPGLVIHIVPQKKSIRTVPPKSWLSQGSSYKAYIANRESFKDLIVSPSMFLDHLPWRCDYAMRQVLKSRRAQNLDTGSQMV